MTTQHTPVLLKLAGWFRLCREMGPEAREKAAGACEKAQHSHDELVAALRTVEHSLRNGKASDALNEVRAALEMEAS